MKEGGELVSGGDDGSSSSRPDLHDCMLSQKLNLVHLSITQDWRTTTTTTTTQPRKNTIEVLFTSTGCFHFLSSSQIPSLSLSHSHTFLFSLTLSIPPSITTYISLSLSLSLFLQLFPHVSATAVFPSLFSPYFRSTVPEKFPISLSRVTSLNKLKPSIARPTAAKHFIRQNTDKTSRDARVQVQAKHLQRINPSHLNRCTWDSTVKYFFFFLNFFNSFGIVSTE